MIEIYLKISVLKQTKIKSLSIFEIFLFFCF